MPVFPECTLLVVLHGAHPSIGIQLDDSVESLAADGLVVEHLRLPHPTLTANANKVLGEIAALINSRRPLRRVAFLFLVSGFADSELRALAGASGMSAYPILFQSLGSPTPATLAQVAEPAIDHALRYLRQHPAFNVEAGRPLAPKGTTPKLMHPSPDVVRPTRAEGLSEQVRASSKRARRWWVGERLDYIAPSEEEAAREAVLLSIISMDGVSASRELRKRQRALVRDIVGRLRESVGPVFFTSSFHAGTGLRRDSGPERAVEFTVKKVGSCHVDEIRLDTLAKELLIEMRLDAATLERRKWRVGGRYVLILAPDFPYLGVGRNAQLEMLVRAVDICCWIGAIPEDSPQPPVLSEAGVRVRAMHADSAREVTDEIDAASSAPELQGEGPALGGDRDSVPAPKVGLPWS